MAEVDEALKMDFLVSLTNDAILPPNHRKKNNFAANLSIFKK